MKKSKARKQKHSKEERVRVPLYKRIWDFCVDTGTIGAVAGLAILFAIASLWPEHTELDDNGVTIEAVVFEAKLQNNQYGHKRHVKVFYHFNNKYIEQSFRIYPKKGTGRIPYVAVGDTIYVRILPYDPEGPIEFVYNKTKNIW